MTIADINIKARNLVDADTISWTAANLLIDINIAYENTVAEILKNDRTWEFDDANYTTAPILTTNLVNAQNDYSFSTAFLNVLKVHILDAGGNWFELKQLDLTKINTPLEELYPVNGLPEYYDLRYGSIWLYPAPATASVTITSGLRIYAQRNADNFTSAQVTTGTKVPGFAIHHEILAFLAAKDFAMAYRKDRVPYLMAESDRMLKKILEFYQTREKGEPKNLSMSGVNSR